MTFSNSPNAWLDGLLRAARQFPRLPEFLDGRQVTGPMPPTLMGPVPPWARRIPAGKSGAVARYRNGVGSGPYSGPTYAKRMVGGLSRSEEVARDGVATVSTGLRDPGGVSYGSWHLATNRGRPQEFLQSEGARWAPRFQGLRPGTPEFSRVWRLVAAQDPSGFEAAQREFIRRTNYQAALAEVRQRTGADLSRGSAALQDVVWSTAVQHGPYGVLVDAVRRTPGQVDDPAFEEALVRAVYDERSRSWPATRARYDRERAAALAMLAADRDRKRATLVEPIPPRLVPRF